ncbi:ribokinase [Roseovarius sp.]|uniref:ribokinase n=1 Tax=Roseovarius sp. TaxID=1486281 RepID=UPI00261CA947|nr:ribokinase [Roseovarius sp.]
MIFNVGSINADHIYRVAQLPRAGETVAVQGYAQALGGKGANQSIAAARAGAKVAHIGAVGADGDWMVAELAEAGVDVRHVRRDCGVSGHAVVAVEQSGENAILVHGGANRALRLKDVDAALAEAGLGDWLLMQNETNLQAEAARLAEAKGLRVAYSAAPFDAAALRAVLPHVTLLMLNAGEAAQMERDMGVVQVPMFCVTRGAGGVSWIEADLGKTVTIPAPEVVAVDTTGAGDTFAGYLVAGLAAGVAPERALRQALGAAAISVTRPGASGAIPMAAEVAAFLAQE